MRRESRPSVRSPPTECGAPDDCRVEQLVRHYAVDNTVMVTFGNARQRHFTANWVYHLQAVGVSAGLLVGMGGAIYLVWLRFGRE